MDIFVLVADTDIADGSVNRPGSGHSLVPAHLLQELGGGAGQVLSDGETEGAGSFVRIGGSGEGILLGSEYGKLDCRGGEGDHKGDRSCLGRSKPGFHAVGLSDSVRERGKGGDDAFGFCRSQQRANDFVVGGFCSSGRGVETKGLFLRRGKAKNADVEGAALLLAVIHNFFKSFDFFAHGVDLGLKGDDALLVGGEEGTGV